jgi:protein-L-isoaspartate(D-aspartate) O-methyltransferase
VLVAIDPAKGLNNGQPSAHARWMLAAAVCPGDSVLHVGCGTGYYTAIFAELVGAGGRVIGLDVEAGLVGRAKGSLVAWPQAQVFFGDSADTHGSHDVIYVNAGATHARREWLDALEPGGRLIVPLTTHTPKYAQAGVGVIVGIERPMVERERWPLRIVS